MLKKFLRWISPDQADAPMPNCLSADQHHIDPDAISRGAAEVVAKLEEAGYEAFVVGGCVRDLLLGLKPKDFDVATDATPEQAKALFRRSRIIGRRFQIVHVYMGREIVEVTTFRANHDSSSRRGQQSEEGMLLRDNVFGSIHDDALRRDFTVNALYYHPQDNTVYDYADGLPDVKSRCLRIIGNPETRFREDPVRMLRAARFAAKLGFTIEPGTLKPIAELATLLNSVPPARLFDEFLKLFLSGHALETFHQLEKLQLFTQLFPGIQQHFDDHNGLYRRFIEQALTNTDVRIRDNKRVTPAFLLAAILWPLVETRKARLMEKGEPEALALNKAATRVLSEAQQQIAIPRRFSQPMREIWELQLRLPRRSGNRAEQLATLPRFRAGYDFVLLREQAGEDLGGLGEWWTHYQNGNENERLAMVAALPKNGGPRKRRRRRPNRRPNASQV